MRLDRRLLGALLYCQLTAALADPCAPLAALAADLYQGPESHHDDAEGARPLALRGPAGWLVTDPGPHHQAGRALACALSAIDPRPVVALINTRAKAERVLANDAFGEVPIHASAATAATMARRCPACLARQRARLGEAALAGTMPRLPQIAVEAPRDVVLAGLRLRLLPLADGTLALIDRDRLITGDAVAPDDVPDLDEATPEQALAASEALLAALPANGSWLAGGQPGDAADLRRRIRYWRELIAAARAAVERGEPLLASPGLAPRDDGERRRDQRNAQRAGRLAEDAWWATR